jgi:hypothetical protein
LIGYSGFLVEERMFSMAFVRIKFLFDFKPKTGFSDMVGTGSLTFLQSYEKLRTLLCNFYLVEGFHYP